jgi:phosphohistidine phosphatase
VLRHAKSSWDDPSLDDHDRPLTPRGCKAAARIAGYIEQSAIRPQLVLCSTAARARQTLEGISEALGDRVSVEFERVLYHADAKELVERLAKIDDVVSSVMLIGHNPALSDLVLTLASTGADLQRVRGKFPTGALATLSFEGEWRDLVGGGARLVDYVTPKDLV